MTTTTQRAAQMLVDAWNELHPIGTSVRYWPGFREGDGKTGRTRSTAQLLGGHTPVVWVEGATGSIALTHVDPAVSAPESGEMP